MLFKLYSNSFSLSSLSIQFILQSVIRTIKVDRVCGTHSVAWSTSAASRMEAKPHEPRVGFVVDSQSQNARAGADTNASGQATNGASGLCQRCKVKPIEFENDPCGCPFWCKGCAMKVN